MLLHLSELICKSTKSTHFRASCNLHVYKSSKGHIIFSEATFCHNQQSFKSKTRSCFSFLKFAKALNYFSDFKTLETKNKSQSLQSNLWSADTKSNVSQRTWKLGLESPPWKLERNKRHNFLIKPQVNQGFLQNKNHLTTPRALIKDQKKSLESSSLSKATKVSHFSQ